MHHYTTTTIPINLILTNQNNDHIIIYTIGTLFRIFIIFLSEYFCEILFHMIFNGIISFIQWKFDCFKCRHMYLPKQRNKGVVDQWLHNPVGYCD